MPKELDDAIKGQCYEHWINAAGQASPDELLDLLPMACPTTHRIAECPGASRFPVDDWEEARCPYMSEIGWCNQCMNIAEGDLDNLGSVMESCQTIDKEERTKALEKGKSCQHCKG